LPAIFFSANNVPQPPVPVSVHPTTTSCPLYSWRTMVVITSLCLLAAILGRMFPRKWPCCPNGWAYAIPQFGFLSCFAVAEEDVWNVEWTHSVPNFLIKIDFKFRN
jgi:hypothetical protein